MAKRGRRSVSPDEPVRRGERWTTSISWPAAVDERLRSLTEEAIEAGEADTLARNELLAALVCAASSDGAALRSILQKYRQATVADIQVVGMETDPVDGVIYLQERKPGRRRATRS